MILKSSPARILRRYRGWAVAAALLFAALAGPLTAQAGDHSKEKPYALIFGTVWDPDGRAVYGVRVKIRRADQKKAKWEVYSNHSGEFAQRLPPDKADYVVWADVKDFKTTSGKNLRGGTEVTVHVDDIAVRYDIGLHLTW